MRLVLVELTRFRSRRAVVLMLLTAAVLAAVLAGATIWETRPISAGDRAAAQAQAKAEAEQPYIEQELRRCRNRPQRYGGPGFDAASCERIILPRADWFLDRPTLKLAQERQDSGLAAVMIVCSLMMIIGTTFVGADWGSGSMSNQLLFQPRRLKVWLAKAVAVTLSTFAASAIILGGFWLSLYVAANLRDIAIPDHVLADIAWMSLRGVTLASLAALGGYALTMAVRHTVATLAVLFAYSVGGEALTAALPIPGGARWSLFNNVLAWLQDGTTYYDDSLVCRDAMCDQTTLLPLSGGAAYLGVLLLFVVVVSMISFRRRDVS